MTSVTDMFPTVFRKGYRRELLLLCLCAVCFFLGLLLVTEVRDMWEGGREGVNTVTFLLIVFNLHSQSFFGPVGWLVLPSTLWPLRLQWQQPSPSVSVSIHSDRMDIWLVTFSALLFHFSCGIRIVASVRPAKNYSKWWKSLFIEVLEPVLWEWTCARAKCQRTSSREKKGHSVMNWKRLTAIIQSMTSMSTIGYNINILHNKKPAQHKLHETCTYVLRGLFNHNGGQHYEITAHNKSHTRWPSQIS